MADADAYDEFEPLENSDEDDEVEPLEIVPYPVAIEAHDPEVGGPSVVRSSSVAAITRPHQKWTWRRW